MGRMWFAKSRSRLTRGDPLASRPVGNPSVTIDRSIDGGARLKLPVTRRGFFKLPEGATRTFELDEMGVFVWDRCDGKTSVEQILRDLASHYNLNLREVEVSTMRFLEMLGRRGLIEVKEKVEK